MEARVRILEKTSDLFSKHGIRRVTMDDIATQCGISKKTIYQYFKDKDELIDAFAVERLMDSRSGCERDKCRAENAVQELFFAMETVEAMFEALHPGLLYDVEKYYPDTFSKFKKYKEEFLYGVIRENLEWGIRDGLYRKDVDIKILTRFRLESMLLPFNLDIFPESRYEITVIEQEIMELFLYGVATEKGRTLIEKYKIQRSINRKVNG